MFRRYDAFKHPLEAYDQFAGLCALGKVSIPLFEIMLNSVGMTAEQLAKQYIGKNVLNRFRQDLGYKQGTYNKDWNGREDNEVLSEILSNTPLLTDHAPLQIYLELERCYAETQKK